MKKLFEFQNKIKSIRKDSENSHFHNKYFDINTLIETIKPVLEEIGLVVIQPIIAHQDGAAIKTLVIDQETGEVLIESVLPLLNIQDPQKLGGCITYFRRYALQSALLLEAEDDDGNTASGINTVNNYTQVNTPNVKPAATSFSRQVAQNRAANNGYAEKVVGGICPDCGGTNVKWASGRIGCGNKCFAEENKHLREEYKANKKPVASEELTVTQADADWVPPVEDIWPN